METVDFILRIFTALGVFGAFGISFYGVIISLRTHEEVVIVKKETNGMKEELVKEVRAASFAKGVKQEKERAKNV